MESQSMMIDPNDLVIDLPVDEANVQLKMDSIRQSGLIQPLTVWLQGLRIIDGFHRAVACQRLGMTQVPAHVVDCDEAAFWDARIQSARQHHTIEDKRLAQWMLESWKLTNWAKASEKLDSAPCDLSDEEWNMAEAVYRVFREGTFVDANGGDIRSELLEWLKSKSERWGCRDVYQAVRMLYKAWGIDLRRQAVSEVARRHDLTLAQRLRLVAEGVWHSRNGQRGDVLDEYVDEYVTRFIKPNITYDKGHFSSFILECDQSRKIASDLAQDTYRQQWAEERRKEEDRLRADPEYRREKELAVSRSRSKRAADILQEARTWVRDIKGDLAQAPDGQSLLQSFITDVTGIFNELWPEANTYDPAFLSAENKRLHNRIKELERDLAVSRRGQGIAARARNALATPSAVIEAS